MLSEFSAKTCLHTHDHSSNIHDNQGVEASRCLSADEWIRNNVVHMNTRVLLRLKKKKRRRKICQARTQRNLEDLMLSEISQSQDTIIIH